MANINFIEKESIQQEEQARYWFEVDGETFCLADTNGDLQLLDEEGYPIEECNGRDGVKEVLISEYEKYVNA